MARVIIQTQRPNPMLCTVAEGQQVAESLLKDSITQEDIYVKESGPWDAGYSQPIGDYKPFQVTWIEAPNTGHDRVFSFVAGILYLQFTGWPNGTWSLNNLGDLERR